MPLAETLAVLMVVAVCVTLLAGYPVALTLGGVSLAFAIDRASHGRDEFHADRRAAAAHVRRDDQRGAARHPALHLHGRDAGALADRRGTAGDHGAAVRHAHRRARDRGADRRRPAGGRQGHRRRHHRDHGADRAADHAAPRLRPAARGRHGGGDRDAGANLSARHRAGPARRPDEQRLPGGATVPGHLRAALGHGRRPVRRRDHSGLRAGRALSHLPDRRGGLFPEDFARDAARSRCAARPGAGRAIGAGAGRADPAHSRGARLDPRRHRDADRGGIGRRGRRHPAGRRQAWRHRPRREFCPR